MRGVVRNQEAILLFAVLRVAECRKRGDGIACGSFNPQA